MPLWKMSKAKCQAEDNTQHTVLLAGLPHALCPGLRPWTKMNPRHGLCGWCMFCKPQAEQTFSLGMPVTRTHSTIYSTVHQNHPV